MKIWYDACTGKHMRYGITIARHMRKLGYDFILTTRKHPDTLPLAKLYGENPIVVGKYAPASKLSRLRESSRRILSFCRLFENEKPDLAMMHVSIECARTAFGLGIPLIATFDTPHAEAQCRLTVPLTNILIAPKAIPKSAILQYGAKRIISYEGVDEVAWIKNFKPLMKFDYENPLIVVRQMEVKAAYAEGISDLTEHLAKKLTSLGNVIFLARYNKKPRKNLIVPRGFVDIPSLLFQADLVLSVGGTSSREAALLGVPSLIIPTFSHSYINDYLARKGFPLFKVKPSEVMNYARKYLGKKWNTKELLEKLENPVDVIEKVVKEYEAERKR